MWFVFSVGMSDYDAQSIILLILIESIWYNKSEIVFCVLKLCFYFASKEVVKYDFRIQNSNMHDK